MKKLLMSVTTVCLVACQGDTVLDSQALANTEWVLKYSQSDIGLQESLSGLFTVKFDAQSQMEVSHQCGTYMTTYTAEYTSDGLSAPIKISSMGSPDEASCDTTQLMAYQNTLNAITDYDLNADTLILNEGNIASLILVRRFNLCSAPASLTGSPPDDVYAPITVWLDVGDNAHPGITQVFDEQYPDFMVMPSSECDARILASMNRNTLDQLRCNDAVNSITYR